MTERAARREVVHVLKTKRGSDLNGYVFVSEQHAKEWMEQEFVKSDPAGYRVERWMAREAKCSCGARRSWKLLKRA